MTREVLVVSETEFLVQEGTGFRELVEVAAPADRVVLTEAVQGPPGAPGRASAGAVVIPYAPTIAIDCKSIYDVFQITLTGPCTVDFFNGGPEVDGKRFLLRIKQDGVGGHLLTLGNSTRLCDDMPHLFLTVEPNKKDYLGFVYDHDSETADLVSFSRGYSTS